MTDLPQENPTASNPSASASNTVWERAVMESVALGYLKEQRRARQWRNGLRLAWLVFLVVMSWVVLHRGASSTSTSTAHTAVIEIKGEIDADGLAGSGAVVTSLRLAFEDEGSQAVVLLINSPGGSPVQAGIINDEILRLKKKHNKPVYAVVEESCASAAYYIAVAADQIYVDKASIVGSIGVLMDGFGFTGLMDKLGVERRLMTAGENKGFMDPFSPQTEKQRVFAQAMLDQIHQQLLWFLILFGILQLKETPELFSGLFWNGQRAVELGLADGLGSLDYVARDIVKAEDLVDYTQRDNVAERLVKRFGASVGEGMGRVMRASLPNLR